MIETYLPGWTKVGITASTIAPNLVIALVGWSVLAVQCLKMALKSVVGPAIWGGTPAIIA